MWAKWAAMNPMPPREGISRTTRLLAAVIIAIVALGITWMADRWLRPGEGPTIPLLPR